MKTIKEIIKATLFVAGEGIELENFSENLNIPLNKVKKAVEVLKTELNNENGIHIIQYKNKIQLASNPKYVEQITKILNPIREKALTRAMLETVAIIAYKQPITRLEIEDIRRVSCDYALNVLEEHKMIEVVGRKEAVGKPLLYGTTDEFLKRFGLVSLNQLPNYEELMERIAIIRQDENQSDNLYNDFKLQDLSAKQEVENQDLSKIENQDLNKVENQDLKQENLNQKDENSGQEINKNINEEISEDLNKEINKNLSQENLINQIKELSGNLEPKKEADAS